MTAGLPILMAHALDPAGDAIATDPAWFAHAMRRLAGAGFRALDLHDWLRRGRPREQRAFVLTFDDGLRSLAAAVPVLVRHGFRATVFLVTGRMGRDNAWPGQPRRIARRPLLGWSDLPQLASAGFAFGSHTCSHPELTRCRTDELTRELRESRDAIEQALGQPCPLLAYPYGAASPRVRAAAAPCYTAACGTNLRLATPLDPAFDLPRIDFRYLGSDRDLDDMISGHWPRRLRLRRTLRAVGHAGRRLGLPV